MVLLAKLGPHQATHGAHSARRQVPRRRMGRAVQQAPDEGGLAIAGAGNNYYSTHVPGVALQQLDQRVLQEIRTTH